MQENESKKPKKLKFVRNFGAETEYERHVRIFEHTLMKNNYDYEKTFDELGYDVIEGFAYKEIDRKNPKYHVVGRFGDDITRYN
jgi:hypothetical protein